MSKTSFPNELLRKQLFVAGIPTEEHSYESLITKLPGDFNTELMEPNSANMVAELLLYFISKGIVTVPQPSEKALLNMPWGSHVCQFYEDKNDLINILVPYFKQGLERNEACLWLVCELTIDEAYSALEAQIPNLDYYVENGQLQILHYSAFYTNSDGSIKPADLISESFAQKGAAVKTQGFAGLRASGNASWIPNEESMAKFMAYETQVNDIIQSSQIMAVCTYPTKSAGFHICRELIHNHGNLFVKHGEWVYDKSRDAEKVEAIFTALASV